ncbi:MAG: rhodanese-like domain-containing protein [Acidimicrobiales bacterium]
MNDGTVSTVDPNTLAAWLTDGDELALLDAREEGVYFQSHLFHATNVPVSKLELVLGDLVPRFDTRLVWCDDGASGLASRAAARAGELGWSNQFLLTGGTEGWQSSGHELYAGVNVPSKAFGEFVEHTYGTPRLPADEVAKLLDTGADVVVLDSRPLGEFRRMSIPAGVDCPGAELVHRVKEVAPDPDTLVIVNCAGRTRSIIGAQSLINAGLENRVVALENGTMGWQLAGHQVATGLEIAAPAPSDSSRAWAIERADRVRERFGVEVIDDVILEEWLEDRDRTTYLFDVRSPEEYLEAHRPGTRHAAGGQLVQATDTYIGTRNARVVLFDDDGVRASMTASWLRQMGWRDAVVMTPAPRIGESGPSGSARIVADPLAPVDPTTLVDGVPDGTVVIDLASSLAYRRHGHLPGAYWAVRSRLAEARAAIGDAERVIVTSSDGALAALAAGEVATRWPNASVSVLAGGTRAWIAVGGAPELGLTRPTTEIDDIWYKPYDHDDDVPEQHMQDYLTWEVALVEQLARDSTVSFEPFS